MGISTPLISDFLLFFPHFSRVFHSDMYYHQAMAQAVAQGFQKYKPGPWAKKSHQNGPGLAWPVMAGFGWLLASSPSQHITTQDVEFTGLHER
jgi:hypothetical protein